MMNTRFDIVTVEIFTSYSNKRYWAGYWILAPYKYIIIILHSDIIIILNQGSSYTNLHMQKEWLN